MRRVQIGAVELGIEIVKERIVQAMNTRKGNLQRETIEPEELEYHVGEKIQIHGFIYKIRKMKGFAFVLLRTKRDILQCIYTPEKACFSLDEIKEESAVVITAEAVLEERSRTGYDLQLLDIEILSEPEKESPIVINNKIVDTSMENLLNYRPITLRNEKQRAIFKLQEGISNGFRRFLMNQNFTEIHTPKLVQSGAEGGANLFNLDYFGEKAYLAQSPQVYKQMMIGVFERVFEIGPVFRAEKHDTSRHLNEYTSVDFEMGFIRDFHEIMEMETAMLRDMMVFLKDKYAVELALLNVSLPETEEIPEIRFAEAKEWISREYKREICDWEDFEPEEEKLLYQLILQETGSEFVFVTHYPSKKRPFYAMDSRENPEETESFDLLFRGLEVTTGGQRIHEFSEQVAKMERLHMNCELFDSYLMMHRYGMPPHGGLGIGLERFTARLLKLDNVRLAALFPRDLHRLVP